MRLWTWREIEARGFWWRIQAMEYLIRNLFFGVERNERMQRLIEWAKQRNDERPIWLKIAA